MSNTQAYYQFFCDDAMGEVCGFLTQTDTLRCIHWFDCNDAVYRAEYERVVRALRDYHETPPEESNEKRPSFS